MDVFPIENPLRGIVYGILFSLPLWGLILGTAWYLMN